MFEDGRRYCRWERAKIDEIDSIRLQCLTEISTQSEKRLVVCRIRRTLGLKNDRDVNIACVMSGVRGVRPKEECNLNRVVSKNRLESLDIQRLGKSGCFHGSHSTVYTLRPYKILVPCCPSGRAMLGGTESVVCRSCTLLERFVGYCLTNHTVV
ncbi:hypothetical protein HAPAU_36240 [Halalkalicoccus paucihalophilus]|uniref:Uncharacterized protein n=1 Tax=Halalkalicoccus paucihalophilus TaxID=1008153 RepID=A0A151AAC8_9EURY|nr:hypothetical protein HAPAU_36240 [Halalkalicoccus paucihalophilus]